MIYSKAVKATTNKIQEGKNLLQSLYNNKFEVVRKDLHNILFSKNYNEYVLNDGFFEDITEYNKVKYVIEMFPFIYSQY